MRCVLNRSLMKYLFKKLYYEQKHLKWRHRGILVSKTSLPILCLNVVDVVTSTLSLDTLSILTCCFFHVVFPAFVLWKTAYSMAFLGSSLTSQKQQPRDHFRFLNPLSLDEQRARSKVIIKYHSPPGSRRDKTAQQKLYLTHSILSELKWLFGLWLIYTY